MPEIVDAQVHLWGGLTPQAESAKAVFLGSELLGLMDEAAVSRCVLVPPSWASDGNDASLTAARNLPNRFAVMARVEVERPDGPAALGQLVRDPGVLGIRMAFRREPHATWLLDGTADWVWDEAEKHGVNVMAYAPGKLSFIEKIVRARPNMRLIIDHMGLLPSARGAERDEQLAATLELAKLPNVAVKLSAIPLYSDTGYPFLDLQPVVRQIVETYGAGRCFWGSDLTRMKCGYRQTVTMMTELLGNLGQADFDLVMGQAILDWLGWR
jgi:predicted TIM-barrel fold metal-dependent hydrolase